MHTESILSGAASAELDSSVFSLQRSISILEEDLTISTSTTGTAFSDKTGFDDKLNDESLQRNSETDKHSSYAPEQSCDTNVSTITTDNTSLYYSENAMDCDYDMTSSQSRLHEVLEEAASPEMFESDVDEEVANATASLAFEYSANLIPSPVKPSRQELVEESDKYLLTRIQKFLTGVPPPPSHTISQSDCDDFLVYIRQNRRFFWADPFDKPEDKNLSENSNQPVEQNDKNNVTVDIDNVRPQMPKAGLRNLTTAFDACEESTSISLTIESSDASNLLECAVSNSTRERIETKESKKEAQKSKGTYSSVGAEDIALMSWPEAFSHKCHGIHYNRNRSVEDFENLTLKLCERYIGAETQSTCNALFTKHHPGSARKRLLAKRNIQSPGKRLSHLARRRRTFSSANVLGLGLAENKRVIQVNTKIIGRKGKSPRGKSPRGKSPRHGKSPRTWKSPRGSAKKYNVRKLLSETTRLTVENSKRALFQSPGDKGAGPSRPSPSVSLNNPQRIRRSLFSSGEDSVSMPAKPQLTETRKRKNEEELENPRFKWAKKSLFLDCPRIINNGISSIPNGDKHSPSVLTTKKETTTPCRKTELSESHRKRLLWAVAEALRGRGIGMNHPMFKQYALNLARTVRKYMPDLENANVPRKSGSTSDRMLKLAKRHVLLVVEAKPAAAV